MPVNEPVLALEDEDLSGEGHGEEVHDQYDDAGRHEVSEVGGLVQDWIQCVFHNGFPHALCSMGHILLSIYLQGGSSGRRTLLIDMKLKVPQQCVNIQY